MAKTVMTYEGRAKLESDLARMKGIEMREALGELADARDKGDISENAEYEVAKDTLDKLNNKIQQLEAMLKNCVVINKETVDCSQVQILTIVSLKNIKLNKEVKYTIVPESEVNIKEGKISHISPIGKGLIGSKVGDVVTINAPSGQFQFEVLNIDIA